MPTPAYRRLIDALAREQWDLVVIDQYGMGWALPVFLGQSAGTRPVLVHVAHDHEPFVAAQARFRWSDRGAALVAIQTRASLAAARSGAVQVAPSTID